MKEKTGNKRKEEARIRLVTEIVHTFTVFVNWDFRTAILSHVTILFQQSSYIMSSVYRNQVT